MVKIEDLVSLANRLSNDLDKAATEERKYCYDVCIRLEQLSWEMLKTANELNEIRYYVS